MGKGRRCRPIIEGWTDSYYPLNEHHLTLPSSSSSSDESESESSNENNTDSDATVIYDPKTYLEQQVPAQTLIRNDKNKDVPNFELKRQMINFENQHKDTSDAKDPISNLKCNETEPMDTCQITINDKRFAVMFAEAFKNVMK